MIVNNDDISMLNEIYETIDDDIIKDKIKKFLEKIKIAREKHNKNVGAYKKNNKEIHNLNNRISFYRNKENPTSEDLKKIETFINRRAEIKNGNK